MEHFKADKIQFYIDKQIAGSEANEIEAHIATCRKCYKVYIGLRSLEATLSHSFKEETATVSCPDDWELGALIMEELPSEMSKKISDHTKDCGFCVERAAGYYKTLTTEEKVMATPELWKQKAIQALSTAENMKETKVSLLQRLLNLFPKLPFPIPAIASFAAALLAVAVIVWIIMPGKTKFITIASSEKLLIRDSEVPSTFGFSGMGETKEVNIMEISLKGETVFFNWEPIKGAVEYEFSLKDRGEVVHAQRTITQPVISVGKDIIHKERLYSWLISGKTDDGMYFEYTGDFVFVK